MLLLDSITAEVEESSRVSGVDSCLGIIFFLYLFSYLLLIEPDI